MDLRSKIILISGPTASGKSSFAIKLAKKVDGEIINADSIQVYKQLKILSARPDPKQYDKIRHHLYGFHDVKKNFSTGDWLKLVNKKIKDLQRRKKTPILVGGTGLYFKALIDGLVNIPNISAKLRNQTRNMQKKLGQKKFYEKLLRLDPLLIGKINPTDSQRSIRAYEVKKFTKKSIYQWAKKTKPLFKNYVLSKFFINTPKNQLLKSIELRTKSMIEKKCINEVIKFKKKKAKKIIITQ